jgi:regulatory protein
MHPMFQEKKLTKEQVFQKLKYYCGYQERCHSEAKEKAYSFKLRKTEVEELLSMLIEEGYLNEERFAILFAGGKFRIKQWGRNKIKYELKQKKISDYCIRKALNNIDEKEYLSVMEKLAKKKWDSVIGQGTNQFIKMAKTRDFLLQRGYESEMVNRIITGLTKK